MIRPNTRISLFVYIYIYISFSRELSIQAAKVFHGMAMENSDRTILDTIYVATAIMHYVRNALNHLTAIISDSLQNNNTNLNLNKTLF